MFLTNAHAHQSVICTQLFAGKLTNQDHSQIGCSVPRNIATLLSILQCSCGNCSEQVAPEVASCNGVNFKQIC